MKTFLYLALFILALGCNKPQPGAQQVQESDTLTPKMAPVPKPNAELTALGQFLAAQNFDTARYDASLKNAWTAHENAVSREWALTQEKILDGLESFNKDKLSYRTQEEETLFYPFSGPDFLFADYFYPGQKKIIMAGLEPVGSLPDINSLSPVQLTHYLTALRNALFYPNRLGFYRTLSMEEDFKDKHLNGTIHHLLFYISRLGNKIVGVQPVQLDSLTGEPVDTTYFEGVNGVHIRFMQPGDSAARDLYYFSMDISNDGLENQNKGFLKFVQQEENFYVLLKSASYLLHKSHFDIMQGLIMEKATLIVQDDTGVPYRFVNNRHWDVELYGVYTRTIPLFRNYFQRGLAQAYREKGKGNLPFHIGYNLRHGEYCLMVMERVLPPVPAQSIDTPRIN